MTTSRADADRRAALRLSQMRGYSYRLRADAERARRDYAAAGSEHDKRVFWRRWQGALQELASIERMLQDPRR